MACLALFKIYKVKTKTAAALAALDQPTVLIRGRPDHEITLIRSLRNTKFRAEESLRKEKTAVGVMQILNKEWVGGCSEQTWDILIV